MHIGKLNPKSKVFKSKNCSAKRLEKLNAKLERSETDNPCIQCCPVLERDNYKLLGVEKHGANERVPSRPELRVYHQSFLNRKVLFSSSVFFVK